ncbi:MAG: FliM/FliN family flagellar motor switch protein [Pseudomonadota bacterium]
MSTGSDSSVIRKKALNGREDFDARAMSWSKAARLSLERISDRLFGLQLSVRTVEQVNHTLSELREVASGDRLIMLLDAYGDLSGDDAHAGVSGRAAVILDRGLVQTLVEVQTRGRITEAELETRVFTHTDAAVTAQLIDPVLASVDEMMSCSPHSPDPLRLRYGDKVEDTRALLLALEAPDYVLFRISLDIESGMRSSEVLLAIPDDMLRPPPPAMDTDEAETGTFDLSSMALSAPIELNAVVARLNMPLSRVCNLKPGDKLTVESSALVATELVGSKGFVLGKVVLGQMNGFRAVRLSPETSEEAVASLDAEGTTNLTSDRPAPNLPGAPQVPALQTEALEAPDLPVLDVPGSDLPALDATTSDLSTSDLPGLDPLPELATDGAAEQGDLSVEPLGIEPLELGDLADLSGLDEATLDGASLDETSEGLPDLPAL